MVKTCIVKGCRSRTRDGTECRFFSVPAVPRQLDKDTQQLCADRHRKWIEAAGHDASEFDLKKHHRICSVHFVSGTCYLRCVAINQLVIQCRKSWAYQRHFVFMLALYWISNSVSNTPPVLRFPLRSARILISALSLGAYYCQQLTLSVCLSRCLSVTLLQIASFLFLDGIEPFFDHQFFMWHSTKTLFFDFWFRPPNAQNYCPEFTQNWLLWQIDRRCLGLLGGFQGWPIQWNHAKCCAANPCHGNEICTESSLSRLVWQIDWRCLGLPGGFRQWLIQWNHAKCCGADPCCHGNDIWDRHGDPVTYRLVYYCQSVRNRKKSFFCFHPLIEFGRFCVIIHHWGV